MKNIEQQNAISMTDEVISNCRDINNILTIAGEKPCYLAPYSNPKKNSRGIADLICEILKDNCSVFPKECEGENTKENPSTNALRPVAIAGSMFTEEIIEEVQNRFSAGSCGYPETTIKAYLSVWLCTASKPGDKKMLGRKQRVGKITLNPIEDSERDCDKPRCKWFLLNNQ